MILTTTLYWPVGFLLLISPLKDNAYYVKTLLARDKTPGSKNCVAYRHILGFQQMYVENISYLSGYHMSTAPVTWHISVTPSIMLALSRSSIIYSRQKVSSRDKFVSQEKKPRNYWEVGTASSNIARFLFGQKHVIILWVWVCFI